MTTLYYLMMIALFGGAGLFSLMVILCLVNDYFRPPVKQNIVRLVRIPVPGPQQHLVC